jgi:hypothetical protein
MGDHPTTELRKTVRIRVDQKMVPLIAQLWSHNLWTVACCQGEPDRDWRWKGWAYIVFALDYHADIFAKELRRAEVEHQRSGTAGAKHTRQGTAVHFPQETILTIAQHLLRQRDAGPLGLAYETSLVFGHDGDADRPKLGHVKPKKKRKKRKG